MRGIGPTALLVLASLAVALVAAAGTSAAPNRFDMGVYDPTANQGGPLSGYSWLSPGLAMLRTKQTGAQFVRIPIRWDWVVCSGEEAACDQLDRPVVPKDPSSIDGRAQPAYSWSRSGWYDYGAEIQAALGQGLEPVLSVFGIPAFAECDGTGSRPAAPGSTGPLSCTGQEDEANYRPNPPDYADFMAALSARFPRVHYFQVLNEPNFSVFLKPARSWRTITYYRRLVNRTYDAIHHPSLGAVGRGDYVIAGGTSPNPRTGPDIKAFAPQVFADRLVRRTVKFDIYDTHPYTQGGPRTSAPPGFGAIWMGDLWKVDRILKKAKRRERIQGRPLQFWAGEFGWDSAPADCVRLHESRAHPSWGLHRAVTGRLLTRWVSESAYRMWRQGVSVMIWGQLKDFPIQDNPHQGGLYLWGGNEHSRQGEAGGSGLPLPVRGV